MFGDDGEKLLPLNEAAHRLGRRISRASWWRWATSGVRGHILRLTRVGGRLMVRESDLSKWIAEINGEPAHTPRTGPQRASAIAAAEKVCQDAGL